MFTENYIADQWIFEKALDLQPNGAFIYVNIFEVQGKFHNILRAKFRASRKFEGMEHLNQVSQDWMEGMMNAALAYPTDFRLKIAKVGYQGPEVIRDFIEPGTSELCAVPMEGTPPATPSIEEKPKAIETTLV